MRNQLLDLDRVPPVLPLTRRITEQSRFHANAAQRIAPAGLPSPADD